MGHTNHVRLTGAELTPDLLEGATIYGPDDSKIGSVNHVHGSGAGAQVTIDVGGFLGIGAKPVAVAASDLDFMRDTDGEVHAATSWTKDQLKAMPEHMDLSPVICRPVGWVAGEPAFLWVTYRAKKAN